MITVNDSIFADVPARGGLAFLAGYVTKETEKAVLIDYAIEPVFIGAQGQVTIYTKSAWIPKSVIVPSGTGSFEIKQWFRAKMKPTPIKPYFLNNEGKKVHP